MTKGMSSLRLFMRNGPRRTVSDGGGEASSSENDGAVAQNQQARQPLGPITEAVRNPPTHAVDQSIGGPPPPSPRGSKSDYHHSTNGRGKGRTISSHEQERFPHLENSESVANLNNNASDFSFNAVAPSASAPSNTKNNGKFSWHHRQGTHSRDASLDLSTPPRHSKQSTNVDAAAPSGNSLGGHQVLVGLPRAGSNGGGSVPSTPKSARAGSSNDSETGGSRSQHGTPSKTVSRSLKYGQQASSTNSGASGTTTVRSAVPQHNITRPAASYMQPVKSLIPQPIQQHFAVQHFGIEEDPKFWRDHNVQVLIRTRPISSSEQAAHGSSRCLKQESPHTVSWLGQPESRFTFDHVAGEIISQAKLFEVAGLPMVENCMSGYNSCMFAYGQTGSGKTHTMLGDIEGLDRHPSENRGMTPRVFEYLFGRIRMEQEGRRQEHLKFFCKCSFLEIYNEQITDLLEPSSTNLQMREDAKKGVYVENLSEFEVQGVHDVIQLLLQGAANRKVAATNMNRESSRSHSVFTCVVESKWESNSMTNSRYGRLHLVDLAGSERQKSSGAEGGRLKEAANINKSLSTLGLVIMILVDVANGKQRHVPYRDSKLTFLLQDSLGGNSKTIMIANVSPSSCCAMETLSTLKFAQRAKFIRNNAVINEDAAGDVIALRRQINELKVELDRLRRESLSRTPSLRLLPLQSGSIGRLDSEDLMEIDSGAAERSSPDSVNTSSKPKHNSTAVSADKKKSLEAVLAGALRREQSAEDNNKKLAAEIEQLNRLVRQREEDSQCSKMMLRFREEKIRRLEGITDNTIPTDSFYEKENKNLVDELQLLRGRLDRNPELTRFAMENIRLMEQLRSYQEFFECGQKDALLEEMSGLRDQLLDTLDAKLGGEQRLTTPQKKALAPEFAALTRENELLLVEVESYRKELKECRDNLNSLVEANADMARQVDDLQATVKHLKTEHNQTETQKQDEHWQMNVSIRTQLEEQLQNALREIDILRRKVPVEEQVQAEATLQAQLQEQLKNALAELDGLRGRAEENDQTEVNVSMRTALQEQLTNALHELDNLRRQMQVLDEAKEQLVFAETVARRPHLAEAILTAAQETASSAQLTVRQIREETEELASQHKQSLTDIEKATLTWRDQELELRSRLRDAEQIIQKLTQPEERMEENHDVASEDGTCTGGQQEELETLRKTEMRHSEEMTQLRLELESIEKAVREEKEQRLAAEQKCEHLVSQLNAELSKVKQAEALVEALEGQQLFSLHELENLQAEHAETLTALKLYEEERNARQGQFHNECVDADPAYHLLEHKLHRARKAKEEARRINIQFQEEKASQLARDKEREVIMSEVETQAALAITMLQSEILDLKEEISAAAETEANSSLQILQLRKELESVEQIVGQLEEQNRRLIDEHERQNVAAAESRIEKDKLLIRESEKKSMAAFLLVHEILSGLEQLKATKQMLDNECLEKTKSLSELEVVIDSLEQKIRRDRDELADISTRHRTLTEAHASQQSENDRLVRESELNKQELTMNVSSQREMQEAKFAVVETESKMAALQQQLDESSRTYSLLADQHRVLDNTQQRLREDYEHSQRQCAKLQVEKESAQAQCERLLEENAAIKSEEENSIQHSDRKAMVAFVALEHLTERMAELRATNERLEIALVSTEQETEQRTSALTTLQQELGQERHHSREMVSRFDLLNDKCQSLQEQYNHREEELKKLLGEVEDMERRNKLSERRCMAAFVLLEQTAEKMKSLKAENAGLERDVQGATDTGAHKDSMISSQQLQLEHEIQLRKDVASRHDILMEEHESLRSEHLRIETAIVDVKDQNSQKNAELHALQQQLEHELRQNTTLAERYQLLTEQYQKLRGDHERVLADHEVRLGEYASLVESKDRSIKVSDRKAMAAYVILEHLTDSRKDLREETARLARQIQEAEAQKENQLLVLRQELEINSHHYSEIEERQRLLMDANENLREEHMRSQAEHLKLLEEKCSIVENGERMLMLSERKTLAVSMALGQLSDSRAKLIEENEFLKREIQEKRTQNESQLLTLQAELERKVHRCSEIEDRQQLLTEAHERLRDEHRRSHESYENILRANAMVVDDRERTIRLLEKNTAVAFVVVAHLRDKGNDLKVENARLTREMSETAAQSETQRLALQQESERNINQSSEFEDRHMLLMGEHERLRTAYETSQGQYDRLLRAQENSQAEHERFRQKFEELQASHESLRAEYGESQLERERLLRLSASKDEEKHRLVRMAERKSMAAAVTVAQLARKKEVLEEEHARLAHEARQTRSALADVHERWKGDHDQQRTELANSCEKNAFLEREVSVAFLVLQHISNQQHELTVKTEKLTMDVEAAKRSIREKNSEISVLRKQLELECDNNAKAVDQHLRLKDVNKMLHDELEILRAEGMSIVDIREKLVRQAEAKAYAAFVTLGHFRSANKDLETANENLKSQVRESLLRIDTTNRAITALEQQLEEGVLKNKKGSDDYEQLTDAHQNLLDEHGQLEATLVRTVAEKSLMLEERELLLNASERKASAAFVLLEQLRNGSEDLLVENDSLKEELRELQHLCAEKDITVSRLQGRFDDYERRVQTTLETTEQQVANLETRALKVVTSALFLYDTAYVDGDQVSTSLRELETLLSGGSEVKEAASRLGVIESEAEFLLSMVTQLEEDNAEAQGRVERLECRVSSLMTTVDARERELKNAREERDEVLLAIEVEAARSKGWEEERAALTTDREEIQSKSLEKERAVQDLRLQVQTLESNLKLADLRVAEMLTSVQALTVAKDEAELEKQRLAVSVENAEANCSQKERALATLQCDLAELHSRISEAEIREQSVCERMEEVTADKMELEAERADLEREIKKMKDEKAHLGVDVQLLNDEIFQRESTLLESFGKSQIALDKIDCRVEAMVEDLVGLETSKYNLEHVLESLESAASSQSDALEEKEFENVDLKKRLETAELKIAELLTALDASSARGRVEQELWEAKERKMQDEHKAWEAQRRDEIGELQDANANLEHEMASAKLASSHRKAALEAKEFEVVNMQRRLETAESQVSERQAAIESVIRQFQHEKDAWEEDKRYQERKAHSRDIEISEQIAAAEAKLLTTESHLKSAAEAVERLTLSKVHLEDEMAKLHENAKISQSNIDSQQDHIATLKAASEKLKVEGEEAQKKLTTLTELRDHYILSEMNWRSEREQLTQRLESLEVTSLSRYTATDEGGLVARSLPLEQSEEIQVQLQKHRRDNDALRAMVTEKDRTILSAKKEMEIAISNLKEAEMEMEKVHREKQRLSRHCLENNDMIDSISHKLRSAEEELWKRETRIEGCEAELQKVAVILSEWDVKMHVVEEEWRKEKEALAQELTEAKLDASEKRSEAAALLQKFQEGQATLREAEGLVDALVRANENAKNHAFDWQCEKQNLGIVQGWWMPERDRLVSKIAGLETDMHTQKQDMWMVCKEALVGMAETMNVLTVANQEVTILDNFLHEEMEQLLSEMASMKADVVAGLKIPRDFSLELESLCTNYRDMLEEARGVRDLREKPLGSETATAGSNQNLTETVLQVTSERDAARKQNSDLMADIGKLDERVCDFLLRAEEDKDDFSFDTVVGRHQELLNVNDEKIFNRELCRVHAQADRLYHALKLKRKQVESLKESLSKEEAERVEFVQISNDKIVRLTEEGNEYKTNLAHSGEELARLGQELKRSREVAALQRERISAAEAEVKRMSNMLQLSEHNALGKEHSVNSMILELEESRFKLARAAENLSDLKLQLTEAQGTVHQLQREQELNSLTINELDEKLLSARKESAFLVEKHDFQIRQWEEERGVSEDQLMEQLLKQNALGGQLEHSRLEKEATMLENSKLLTRVKNVQESHSACVHDLNLSQRVLDTEVSVLKQLQVELKVFTEEMNDVQNFVNLMDEVHADIEDLNSIARGLAFLGNEVRDLEELSIALELQATQKYDSAKTELRHFEAGRATILGKLGEISRKFETIPVASMSQDVSVGKIRGNYEFTTAMDQQLQAIHADIEHVLNDRAVLAEQLRTIQPRLAAAELEVEEYKTQLKASMKNQAIGNEQSKDFIHTHNFLKFTCADDAFETAITACHALVSDMPKSAAGLDDFQALRNVCSVHRELREEFEDMKEDILTLQAAMKAGMHELQSRNTDLEEELDEKRHALDVVSEEFILEEQELTRALDTLTMQMKAVENERDRFQTEIVVLSEQLEMAQTLADERDSVAAEARQVAELSKSRAEEKEVEARILGRSVEELERTVYALETQLSIVKQEAERQRITREDLEKELDVVRDQMRFMQSKIDEQEIQTLKDSQVAETSKTELDRVVIEMKSQQLQARESVESLQQECAEKDVQLRSCKAHIAELMLGAEKQANENQQKLKTLESMVEQLKVDDRKSSSACPGSGKCMEKSSTIKVKGAGSPFKCIGSALAHQRSSEIDEELSAAKKRIKDLEAVAASRQKEVFMLNTKLAEAESMTHDVVRDLLGVKMDIASYATLLNQQQMQRIAERARRRTVEAQEKEEEMDTLRKRLNEFIDERESWLEEINRRQAEAVAARVSAEKFRLKDQSLVEENEKFEVECLTLRRKVTDLEAEVKKLSGQQNLQQRIHHHAKIKDENNAFRVQVEDLSSKLRRMEMLFTRVNDELARYRSADGKDAFINFDEESRLQRELQTLETVKSPSVLIQFMTKTLQETEENRMQLAQSLSGLCTGIMQAAGVQRPSRDLDPPAAMTALQELQDRLEFLERELSDHKLNVRIAGEKRRISDLRELHTPVRNLSTNFTATQQLPSPVSSAR